MVVDRPIELGHFGFIESFEASSQLLRASNQVHNDAITVIYGNNKFIADSFSAIHGFGSVVGGKAAACVQHLVLHDWTPYVALKHDFSAFQPYTNLKTLCLAISIRAQAPRTPPPCLAIGAAIPNRDTKLLPTTLPTIPRALLNLSKATNGLYLTLAVVFEILARQNSPENGRVCCSYLASSMFANIRSGMLDGLIDIKSFLLLLRVQGIAT